MSVFQVSYFANGLHSLSIVAAENNIQAGNLVNKGGDFELYDVREIDLGQESIIHTEVIDNI